MKTKLSILIAVAAVNIMWAQDTIYTKNGEAVPAKVYEISQDMVHYKKASNPDGPMYSMDKGSISLIEYKNGTKDVFGGNSGINSGYDNSQQQQAGINQQQPSVNNYYTNPPSSSAFNFVFGMPGLSYAMPWYGPWYGRPYYRPYYYSWYYPHNNWGWGGGGYHHYYGGGYGHHYGPHHHR